jgi:hypothetical protein
MPRTTKRCVALPSGPTTIGAAAHEFSRSPILQEAPAWLPAERTCRRPPRVNRSNTAPFHRSDAPVHHGFAYLITAVLRRLGQPRVFVRTSLFGSCAPADAAIAADGGKHSHARRGGGGGGASVRIPVLCKAHLLRRELGQHARRPRARTPFMSATKRQIILRPWPTTTRRRRGI